MLIVNMRANGEKSRLMGMVSAQKMTPQFNIIYMNNLNERVAFQQKKAAEFRESLESARQAQKEYLNSEQYERDVWEAQEKRWQMKAAREGWKYTPKPYVSRNERKERVDKERHDKITALKSELIKLLTEEENAALLESLKASQL